MNHPLLPALALLALLAGPAARAAQAAPGLSAAQIVERNVAARGGLVAWRGLDAIVQSGQLDPGGKRESQLPFVMTMKRPHKNRFEVQFRQQTAYQVFDGTQGWKVRPFLNRNEVEPYTPEETRLAAADADISAPLVDIAAKGIGVALLGTELVEGHNAYKLLLTHPDGTQRRLWVDAASFLELKIEGDPRRLDGKPHAVAIYLRDYRPEGALVMPHLIETAVEGVKPTRKMTIQQVKINPRLDDALFARPRLELAAARP